MSTRNLRIEVEELVREADLGLVNGDLSFYELRLEDGQGFGNGHGLQLGVWDVDGNLKKRQKKKNMIPFFSFLSFYCLSNFLWGPVVITSAVALSCYITTI